MNNLINIENSRKAILAGKAIVTFKSEKTGDHFTYRIRKGAQPNSPFMVSVLTGPDNSSDYKYIGHIFTDNDRIFHIGKKSKISSDSKSVLAFDYTFSRLMQDEADTLTGKVSIHHEGRCCKCGRRLTTPESIERGLGPECAKG